MASTDDLTRVLRYEADISKALAQLDKLTAAADKSNKHLDDIGSSIDRMGSSIESFGKGLLLGLVGGGIEEFARVAVSSFKSIVNAMDELDEASEGLGV